MRVHLCRHFTTDAELQHIIQGLARRWRAVHGAGRRDTIVSRSLAAFAVDEVDVVWFGHSHQPLREERGSVWLVNPG
jgi:predicted phosphodiesterase